MRKGCREMSQTGLGDSEFRVLEVLLHKGPLPVNTIGPKVWLTPGSISVAVDRLENKAPVKRKNTDEACAVGRTHGQRPHAITKTFREHAAAMEEAAGALSKEERPRCCCGFLKNWERAGKMDNWRLLWKLRLFLHP
jgi:MarR family 2-MHQ and catechol resistance regulon transcriptional repressor